MKIFLLIIFLIFTQPARTDLPQCKSYFQNNTNPGYSPFLSGSASHLFGLGKYDSCIKTPNMTFIVLITPVTITNQYTGLCVPDFCTPDDFNTEIIPNVINPILPVFTAAVDPQSYSPTFGAGSIAVIVILCLILLMSLIGPFARGARAFLKVKEVETETNRENDVLLEEKPVVKRTSFIEELLNAFSLDLNLKKIFTLREGKLDFFNCLRALSLFYVIFGHEFLLRVNQVMNIQDLPDIMKTPIFLLASGGFYAVDVFYYLSGFFLAFVVIEPNLSYLKKPFTYVYAIFHRYVRIMPCYLIAILIFWKVAVHLGDGPIFPFFSKSTEICREMWKNVIFIDDFYDEKCFGWGWYLSTDFQIFMYSLIMVYFYVVNRYFGFIAIWLSITASYIYTLVLCHDENYYLFPYVLTSSSGDLMNHYYYRPYTRAPPYLIGLFIGILFKEASNEQKQIDSEKKQNMNERRPKAFFNILRPYLIRSTLVKLAFYAMGLFWINFLIFFPDQLTHDPAAWSQTFQWIYITFSRTFYVFGLFCVTICCLLNVPDVVGFIANWKIWGFIARISFCAYLVHFFVIQRSLYNYRQSSYFSNESLIYWSIADAIITLIVATILSLLVEIPFMNLEKVIKERFGKKKPALIKN